MKYLFKVDAQNDIDTIFCAFLDVVCHLTQRIINTLQTFRIKNGGILTMKFFKNIPLMFKDIKFHEKANVL